MNNKILFYAAAICTFVAGVLHLAIVPMFLIQISTDVTIFFILSGLTQILWLIPVIKRWRNLWYYIGICGTTILILIWFIAVPGSGHQVSILDMTIEIFQVAFIILCYIIITKRKNWLINQEIY
ncbi:MAG: hypothetical protein ACM3XP_03845 [Nitrososphaerales archaeon]